MVEKNNASDFINKSEAFIKARAIISYS